MSEYLRFPAQDGVYVLYQYQLGLRKWVETIVEVSDIADDSAIVMEPGGEVARRVTTSPSKRWVLLPIPPPPDAAPKTKNFNVLVKKKPWLRVNVEAENEGAARQLVRARYNELDWEKATEDDPEIEDVEGGDE